MNGRPTSWSEAGFTYLSVLFAVVVMGIVLSRSGVAHRRAAERAKEEELLFRGLAIKRGIAAYYRENGRYPSRLEDLVRDPGLPYTKRYLRRLYADPLTGKADWELMVSSHSDGTAGITGVRSRGVGEPFRKKGFPPELRGLEGHNRYCDWEFAYYGGPPQASRNGHEGLGPQTALEAQGAAGRP